MRKRADHMTHYDVFIIGGGINGCGIARDAAGRGFSIGIAEMKDLASGTSSWSTKLIHGGLRYLEHHEFRLVREALMEREVLWRIAPHIIRPLRFILPYHAGLRPAWLLRLGLFLYDHIGGRRKLPATATVDLKGPLGAPLKKEFVKGFEYSDARVDDARLVVLNARDAAARGAAVMVGTEVIEARRESGRWVILLRDHRARGAERTVTADYLVNVAGPWVDRVIRQAMGRNDARNIRLVQGSHIVTGKLFEHDRAFIFQNADNRIIFAIPYEDDFTLIGTTDRDYEGDPSSVAISSEETSYLCRAASEYFERPVTEADIVWSFSGVRPLFDDGASRAQEATRDYVLKVDGEGGEAPVLNAFGGKITTYRKLAEEVLERIESRLGRRGKPWTGGEPLPGGAFPVDGVEAVEAELRRVAPSLDGKTVRRMVRAYGRDALAIAGAGFGRDLGHGLTEGEVNWLISREWAATAEDILWRRTKLGLRFSDSERQALEKHLENVNMAAGTTVAA